VFFEGCRAAQPDDRIASKLEAYGVDLYLDQQAIDTTRV
jgi:hypothetical protein